MALTDEPSTNHMMTAAAPAVKGRQHEQHKHEEVEYSMTKQEEEKDIESKQEHGKETVKVI